MFGCCLKALGVHWGVGVVALCGASWCWAWEPAASATGRNPSCTARAPGRWRETPGSGARPASHLEKLKRAGCELSARALHGAGTDPAGPALPQGQQAEPGRWPPEQPAGSGWGPTWVMAEVSHRCTFAHSSLWAPRISGSYLSQAIRVIRIPARLGTSALSGMDPTFSSFSGTEQFHSGRLLVVSSDPGFPDQSCVTLGR